MARLSARDLIDLVLDEGSWSSWDTAPTRDGTSEAYAAELAAAAEKSGVDESVLTGEGRCAGGGSPSSWASSASWPARSGAAAADRLVAAIERATARGCRCWPRRPQRRHPDAGGHAPRSCRWSGSPRRSPPHKAAGLPYLVYLRHPTTGGVMASWGSLGHVTVAEPGALVGFLGPAGLRGALRRAVPRGRADRGEPLRPRHHRRRRAARGDRRRPRPRAEILLARPGTASRRAGADPGRTTPTTGRRRLGRRSPARGARTGPGVRRLLRVRRQRRRPAQRHRRRASATPGC